MFTRERKDLLFSGYARSNYRHTIPQDIISLLCVWLSNAAYMIIQGNKLKEFLSKEANECMEEKLIIKITDKISFECSLIPKEIGGVQPYVSWNARPITSTTSVLIANFECVCEEIQNSFYKEQKTLCEDGEENALQMIFPSKCDNKTVLSFYIDIDLVRYKEDIFDEYIYFGVSPIFKSKFEYKWIIDVKGDWIFSDAFMDQSIGMYCVPKGEEEDMDYYAARLDMTFYKIPYKIKYFECDIKLKTNIHSADIFAEKEHESCEVYAGDLISLIDHNVKVKRVSPMKRIEIELAIEITETY